MQSFGQGGGDLLLLLKTPTYERRSESGMLHPGRQGGPVGLVVKTFRKLGSKQLGFVYNGGPSVFRALAFHHPVESSRKVTQWGSLAPLQATAAEQLSVINLST